MTERSRHNAYSRKYIFRDENLVNDYNHDLRWTPYDIARGGAQRIMRTRIHFPSISRRWKKIKQ